MGHLYHGYVSHNQMVNPILIIKTTILLNPMKPPFFTTIKPPFLRQLTLQHVHRQRGAGRLHGLRIDVRRLGQGPGKPHREKHRVFVGDHGVKIVIFLYGYIYLFIYIYTPYIWYLCIYV